jgi:cellulose synthase operon protein C
VNVRLFSALVAALAVSLAVPPTADAQFNPEGRKKGKGFKPGGRAKPGAKPGARPGVKPGAKPSPGPGGEEDEPKGPGSDALIKRYTAIVLAQPGSQFPLQRLAQLYRERDGNLEKLVVEFEQRAAQSGANQWNALVALAGIYKQDGQHERAIATYEKAIGDNPKDATAPLALAHVLEDRGDKAGAQKYYVKALPLIKADAEREQVLRTLMQLSLDLKQFEQAKKYHTQLVTRAKGSFYVRAELGRELLLRNEYQRAVDEYKDVVKAAVGDNRVLAPAQRDLGRALAKLGRRKEAMEMLRKALRTAGAQSGIRAEIYEIIVEVYRADDKLRELITELEGQHPNDFEQLRMLGSLYEETGQVQKALTTYKQALAKKQNDIATRLKVVQLLQIQGELDEAIKQYEELIRSAPRNPDYVFQLAEALIQRGERQKALEHLKKLETRSEGDEETLAALVDFYERVEEKARAMAVLQRLAKAGATDPRHLVDLGDRYWQEGDKAKALQTWQRIKLVVPDKAKALHALGDVYLEHDMPDKAIEALREAMKLQPKNMTYKKAFALALERTGASAGGNEGRRRQYEEARRIWEQILKEAGDNQHLAREARQHIVTLFSLAGQLEQRITPLDRRLKGTPPDLESGRLLGEAQMRLKRFADAEKTLRLVIKHAPGDAGSLTQLERALVQQRKLRDAIEVLRKLVEAEPKRAREYYQRMAQYAAELYQDDEAIRYAARAVDLSPDDAEGHRKLGEMYRRRQDSERAIGAFRQAISKNDRLFAVYFQLAELLITKGELEEADLLLRRVVRASPDEELVAQAARLSMQVNLGRGSLESLEKELLPVALGNPQKPIYRRLLVEIYGAMAFPLAHLTKSADDPTADKARSELKKIGERAVKPLLDALSDERDAQQRTAIELLSYIENKSAGSALYAYATGSAEAELRARAMIAVGALKDPALLPKLEDLLAPGGDVRSDESDPVVVAAAWSVARMQAKQAGPLLTKLLSSDAPSIRALAALGLGLIGDKKSAATMASVARSLEAGPMPRASAAFALGQIGDKAHVDALAQLAESTDSTVRSTAVIALARLGSTAAPRAIAEALVSPEPALQGAAAAAAIVLATGSYRAPRDPLAPPEGRVEVRGLIERLVPKGYSADDRAKALVAIAPALESASVAAVQSSPERARAVADALLARGGKPAYGPLTRDLEAASPAWRKDAEAAAAAIAKANVGPFVALVSHPSTDVRARAVLLLATRSEKVAADAVMGALDDPDDGVQRAALDAVMRTKPAGAVDAVVALLGHEKSWPIRVRAAETLGQIGGKNKHAFEALVAAAKRDGYALVREACVMALSKLDPVGAKATLAEIADKDAEPRVRAAAKKSL